MSADLTEPTQRSGTPMPTSQSDIPITEMQSADVTGQQESQPIATGQDSGSRVFSWIENPISTCKHACEGVSFEKVVIPTLAATTLITIVILNRNNNVA